MSGELVAMFNATAATLRFPSDAAEKVHRYVRQHQGSSQIAEQAPFRRQIDLWALAIAVACAQGLEPRAGSSSSWGKKFVDTRSVQLDPDLADLLVALAASEFGIEDGRLEDPAEVAEIGNRYAAAGIPLVLKWLEDPNLRQTNIEKVIRKVTEVRKEALGKEGIGAEESRTEPENA